MGQDGLSGKRYLSPFDLASSRCGLLCRSHPRTGTINYAETYGRYPRPKLGSCATLDSYAGCLSRYLGKASPGFQMKWSEGHALLDQSGLSTPKTPHTDINHAFISQIALSALLQENGSPEELAILAAAAVGCHHGSRASPVTLNDLDGDRRAIGKDDWVQVRSDLMEALQEVFSPTQIPIKPTLSRS